jgi:hypothetical protein
MKIKFLMGAVVALSISNIEAATDHGHAEQIQDQYEYNLYDWNKDRLRKERQQEARQNPAEYERYEKRFPKYQDEWTQQAPSQYEEGGSPGEFYYWHR